MDSPGPATHEIELYIKPEPDEEYHNHSSEPDVLNPPSDEEEKQLYESNSASSDESDTENDIYKKPSSSTGDSVSGAESSLNSLHFNKHGYNILPEQKEMEGITIHVATEIPEEKPGPHLMKSESEEAATKGQTVMPSVSTMYVFECNICVKCFMDEKAVIEHLKVHAKGDGGNDKDIDPSDIEDVDMKNYTKRKVTVKSFKCEHCGKSFPNRSDLGKHIKTHTGEKPFICEKCGKGFSHNYSLALHDRSHTGEKPFKCEFCGKGFPNSSNLAVHRRLHTGEKPFKCDLCGKSYSQKSNLQDHIRKHTGEKPFKCEHCDKSYSRKSSLSDHMRVHTGKPFICTRCGKGFFQDSDLQAHIVTHVTGEKPYKCEHCGKGFNQKCTLLDHLRASTGEKHDSQCSGASNLNTQNSTHSLGKPFKCEYCGKCFSLGRTLQTHIRTHTGERPFKCRQCGKCFASTSGLCVHNKIHAREELLKSGQSSTDCQTEGLSSDHRAAEQNNGRDPFLSEIVPANDLVESAELNINPKNTSPDRLKNNETCQQSGEDVNQDDTGSHLQTIENESRGDTESCPQIHEDNHMDSESSQQIPKDRNRGDTGSAHGLLEDENYYYDETGKFKILKLKKSSHSIKGKAKVRLRIKNLVHECIYCGKNVTNFAKHIKTHKSEKAVGEILNLEEAKKELTDAKEISDIERSINYRLTMLRQKGDAKHNKSVIEKGTGVLYIARRSQALRGFRTSSFYQCEDCHLWLHTKANLAEHQKHCITSASFYGRGGIRVKSELKEDFIEATSKLFDAIEKSIGKIVIGDHLLMELGMYRAGSNWGNETGHIKYARDRIHRLAMLVSYARSKLGPNETLSSILIPDNFDLLVQFAIREENLDEGSAGPSPTTTKRLKEDILKALELKQTLAAASSQNEIAARELCQKIELLWNSRVWNQVSTVVGRQNVISLCQPSDVKRLLEYIKQEMNKHVMDSTYTSYRRAVQLVLCRLAICNDRQPDDLHHIRLEQVAGRIIGTSAPQEVVACLSTIEKRLLSYSEMLITIGKAKEKLPVLLPPDVLPMLLVIADENMRESVGIHSTLLFANSDEGVEKVSESLQSLKKEIPDLLDPQTITSMRKDICTTCQMIGLSLNDISYLVRSLSQDLQIPETYFSRMTDVIEQSKIGLLLTLKDAGLLEPLRGKKIEEITFEEVEAADTSGFLSGFHSDGDQIEDKMTEDNGLNSAELIQDIHIHFVLCEYKNPSKSEKEQLSSDHDTCDDPPPSKKARKAERACKWSYEEEIALREAFQHCFQSGQVPTEEELKDIPPVLKRFTYEQLHDKCYRIIAS